MTSQTKCFVSFGEMNPFVFAVLAASASETKRTVARWAMELAGLGIFLQAGPRSGRHSQASCLKERCAASRLEGRSEATNAFVGLWSVPTSSGQAFGAAPALQNEVGELQGAKNLRKRALKSLK